MPRFLSSPYARTTATAALLLPLAACGSGNSTGSDGGPVTVTVGYQSKTINTVTAGTLLRARGYFERELRALGKREGRTYEVKWQDYATGAPITAQMTAGKVDIGSMGDFPLLINAARGEQLGSPNRLVSVTGYNTKGALNTIVTRPGSGLKNVEDLRGKKVSTSEGSAADGTLVRALGRAGIAPESGIRKLNQQPAVGASALESGSADALSQFVAWPGLLVHRGEARALYDGAELGLPTFHGVTARGEFAEDSPRVVRAFLRAQRAATDYLHDEPLAAARQVAKATGLPPEVVHLYNGANGIATFDPTIKPAFVDALKKDASLLRKQGVIEKVDVDAFVDDSHLKSTYGKASGYRSALRNTSNPAALPGDPALAGEVWLKGADSTRAFKDPTAVLRYVAAHRAEVRAAYVPDAKTGTRWFAEAAVWVQDANGALHPFVTSSAARFWRAEHKGARTVSYATALKAAAEGRAE
ncbi:ABC transporter substrate-binding protein [Streptomyces ochraceiscleroticus]|uniref:ABC transporter substrate-binding protein n=1 Tax=Streptomyces ochraceiscleroticus TaxID=47761 RepID=A0ABW1MHW1_9ACTN|nr:ABC transporter substrate-binding protein [Streptomyces ochraceiscleroticus]